MNSSEQNGQPKRCVLEMSKIKPVQKFNALYSVIIDNRMCNTQIWKGIGVAKDTFSETE